MKQLAFRGNDSKLQAWGRRRANRKGSKKQIQKIVREMAETKRYLWNNINSAIGLAGGAPNALEYNMTASIIQGDSNSTRDGSQILYTSVYCNLQITFPDSTNNVRMIVYVYNGPHTATPLINKAVSASTYWEPAGFQVLHDKVYTGGTGGPVSKRIQKAFSFKRRKDGGVPIHYSGSGLNAEKNHMIGVYLVSDSGAVPNPTLTGYIVGYYKDM